MKNKKSDVSAVPKAHTADNKAPSFQPEFDVCLGLDGRAVFSWNTDDIQEIAGHIGKPEFRIPRWCG